MGFIDGIVGAWNHVWGNVWERTPIEVPAPPDNAVPAGAEQTGRQDDRGLGIRVAEPWSGVCCGPGYLPAPPGHYQTWRWMDAHPTLSLARAVVCGPIIASAPTFEVKPPPGGTYRKSPAIGDGVSKDPLDKRKEFIESVMGCLWPDFIEDCTRGLSLGHSSFEVIWARVGGQWVVERFKLLLPEGVTLLVDDKGNDAGVRTKGANKQNIDLEPINSFTYTYDCEGGNLYGRPRHENCRLEWWEKLQAKAKGAALDHKASGIIPIVKGPGNLTYKDENGRNVSGMDACRNIGAALQKAHPVGLNNMLVNIDQLPKNPTPDQAKAIAELAKISAFAIEFFDAGNTGPASSAILDKLRYLDSELFRAWHRPEREALEGQQGTKAESQVQGQVGVQDTERTMASMYRQISRGVIDDLLAVNFGDAARGSVYAKAPPLRDVSKEAASAAAQQLLTGPQTAPEAAANLDIPQVLKDANLPLNPNPKPVPPPQPAAPNPPPPRGGNGDTTALARANGEGGHIERLVRMLGEE